MTGGGAFGTRRPRTAIPDRGGTAGIPIRRNARPWKEDRPAARARNDIPRAGRRFGRAACKHRSGDHARSRTGAGMRGLTSFGERIASRNPDRHTAQVHIRAALVNRFTAPGTAGIRRAA